MPFCNEKLQQETCAGNRLHWQLDVSFREDERRIQKGHGAENDSRLSRLALNLLKPGTTVRIGVRDKRLNVGWDEHYLLRLLTSRSHAIAPSVFCRDGKRSS
jgi:hypothetical protein